MGGSHSKRRASRQRSSSSRSNPFIPQYQSPYLPQETQDHGYNYGVPPPTQSYGGVGHASQQSKKSDKKFTKIGDDYNSLDQVTIPNYSKRSHFLTLSFKFDKQQCSSVESFGTIWCF